MTLCSSAWTESDQTSINFECWCQDIWFVWLKCQAHFPHSLSYPLPPSLSPSIIPPLTLTSLPLSLPHPTPHPHCRPRTLSMTQPLLCRRNRKRYMRTYMYMYIHTYVHMYVCMYVLHVLQSPSMPTYTCTCIHVQNSLLPSHLSNLPFPHYRAQNEALSATQRWDTLSLQWEMSRGTKSQCSTVNSMWTRYIPSPCHSMYGMVTISHSVLYSCCEYVYHVLIHNVCDSTCTL